MFYIRTLPSRMVPIRWQTVNHVHVIQKNRIENNSWSKWNNSFIRMKYTTSGVKGFKGRKVITETQNPVNDETEAESSGDDYIFEDDREYDNLAKATMHISKNILNQQNVLVLQPFVKWGTKKSTTSPELKLEEAEELVRSIPTWSIQCSMKVPLETLNKKAIFGKGKLDEIKTIIRRFNGTETPLSCIFISKETLTAMQKRHLEQFFGLPVMDRYSVVIQILRLHATSMEAKLQVAMAELPYIWSQIRENDGIIINGALALTDTQKMMLRMREKKLKNKLTELRSQRQLLRNKRKREDIPIVAVVGYTNAGKTSLIKALTEEERLRPRDQLFATLDVTAHTSYLPCRLKVLFMDTVGFMSELPSGLIECFVATLEDVLLADVIIHIHNIAHKNHQGQRKHVENTLQSLWKQHSNDFSVDVRRNIIHVGNKCDMISSSDYGNFNELHLISSKTRVGINDLLMEIERKILSVTKRSKMVIKVPMGSSESVWLYKNAAVTDSWADPENSQNLLLKVVISKAKMEQFKHYFVNNM